MKRNVLYLLAVLFIAVSCVDDYQDANPPRLLDSPAVSSISITNEILSGGGSTTITITVSDAPAGLDSVATSAIQDGEDIGGDFVVGDFQGLTQGSFDITYTLPNGVSGAVELNVEVFDGQKDEDGESARKSSGVQTASITALCGTYSGVYDINGTILVDDFGSGPYDYEEVMTSPDCTEANQLFITDITGGLWSGDYADAYGASARNATLVVDPASGDVTWSGVSDQFGGEIIQDAAQPTSNIDGSGVITVYWTATGFGERGVTTLTPQ